MKKKPTYLYLIIASLLSNCTYSHQVHNATESPIYNVTVQSGKHSFNHGVIVAKSTAGYCGDISFSPSDPPEVTWQTEDNRKHYQIVSLSQRPGSKYETHFVISESGVAAYFFPAYPASRPFDEYKEFLISIGARKAEDFPTNTK